MTNEKIKKEHSKYEIKNLKCLNCGKRLKPDTLSINFITKKWDEHTYLTCGCMGESENLRIVVG
jgi:transcription elongation factor Elf1